MGLKSWFLIGLSLCISSSFAGMWQTEDQKAYKFFKKQEFIKAFQLFKNPAWKASSAFKARDYKAASQLYKNAKNTDDFYNLGNSLALLGDYANAIKAYNKALSLDSKNKDAKYNLNIIEKLLQKKQQSQSNKNNKDKKQEREKEKSQSSNDSSKKQSDAEKKQSENNPSESKASKSQKKNQNQHDKKLENQSSKELNQKVKNTLSDKEFSQWLKLIENDPQGLLRQKFLRDYQRELEGHKS